MQAFIHIIIILTGSQHLKIEYSDQQTGVIRGQVINFLKRLSPAIAFRDELHGIADPLFGGPGWDYYTTSDGGISWTYVHQNQAGCMVTLI